MKIAASSLWLEKKYGYEKAFRMMKDAGFDAIDYGIDDWVGTEESLKKSRCYTMSDEELTAHFTKIYECARDTGLEIAQTHAVFGAPAARQFPELFKTVTERSIFATSLLHCKYTVIHPIATPGRLFDEKYEEGHAYNLNFFRSLIPALEKYDVSIGLEPMWDRDAEGGICPTICSRPEEILHFIEELGDEHFCCCPDIGHYALLERTMKESPEDAIRKLGKAIRITHVHEVDGINDKHNAPYIYPGAMNWDAILAAFRDIGYNGVFNFEVGGNYYNAYPERMLPEALRHLAEIGRDMVAQIEKR